MSKRAGPGGPPQKQPEPMGAPVHAADQDDYVVKDPEAFARNMIRLVEEGGKALADVMKKQGTQKAAATNLASELNEATRLMGDISQRWMAEPQKLAEVQGELMKGYADLWTSSWRKMLGEPVEPVAQPEAGDNRFRDQAYLLTSKWAESTLDRTEGLDDRTRHKAEFLLNQVTSALSPTNFPATNPEVVRATLASNGENLVAGLKQLVGDLERSGDVLQISQTDLSAFEVGKNLAVTPGKVVFQNDILQLIQYTPTTKKVYTAPLLIVPPWINKFYILDLTSPKSFIRYVVEQGFTVFVISWVNPDQRLAAKTFEDYMKEGILEATEAVRKECGTAKINVVGYCVGGTLLGTTLAWLAAKKQAPYRSATFLTTQVDFTKAGDLKLFIDEAQLENIKKVMEEKGYLESTKMSTVFNLLRPRDLIWPYIVNNYMLGRKPMPFDLLYWNSDSTRMPAANHNFYLREFYHENKLAKGEMSIGGVKLDLKKVKLPIYDLAAREDHIAPAESVYIGARLFGGPVTYVMAGSGHIAGVVNPPDRPKYQHWTNDKLAPTFEGWCKGAEEHPGSWWPHWIKWLAGHSGARIEARVPGAELGVIEDAPGSYVRSKD